jgi:hypothetical protein
MEENDLPGLGEVLRESAMSEPSLNGSNGRRGEGGRFLPGNPGGPGNPHAKKVNAFRSRLYELVTPEDMDEVIRALVRKAKAGEIAAIRELFDRLFGKSLQGILLKEEEPAPFAAHLAILRERLADPAFRKAAAAHAALVCNAEPPALDDQTSTDN